MNFNILCVFLKHNGRMTFIWGVRKLAFTVRKLALFSLFYLFIYLFILFQFTVSPKPKLEHYTDYLPMTQEPAHAAQMQL